MLNVKCDMEIQVGNKTLEVTLLSKEGNQVKIDIDGEVYDVDVAMLQNGTCSLIYDGNSYNAELIRESGEKHYRVNLNYSTYQIDMLDSQAKYMKMRRGGSQESVQADVITAPMPCKIVNIYVNPAGHHRRAPRRALLRVRTLVRHHPLEDCRQSPRRRRQAPLHLHGLQARHHRILDRRQRVQQGRRQGLGRQVLGAPVR